MNIEKDLKEAVRDGRIDRAMAWEIHDLRINLKRAQKVQATAQRKADVAMDGVDKWASRLTPLVAKLGPGTATAPEADGEDGAGVA